MNAPAAPATFADVLRSEWMKLRTVRSTAFAAASCVLMGAGPVALLLTGASTGDGSGPFAAQMASDPTGTVLTYGILVAQLAVMVLGVVAIAGEHASGMILPSVVTVPRRGRLLAAKCVVLALVALVMGTVTGLASFVVGWALVGTRDATYGTLGQPHVLRAVLGAGLYLMAITLLSVAVGTLLRSTAGGISTMVAAGVMLPNFFGFLPDVLAQPLQAVWPTVVGLRIMAVVPDSAMLAPWAGFAVMCAFVAAVVAVAFAVFQRRDV